MVTKVLALAVLVVAVTALLFWVKSHDQSAKISFALPSTTTTGDTFEVPLKVSVKEAINAGEFYFNFPSDKLTVKEIKKDNSFFSLWVKDSPAFDNQTGSIYLAGGLPAPGFSGTDGMVATVVFTAKAGGQATISLNSKSRILANDGNGTQIASPFQPKTITIR